MIISGKISKVFVNKSQRIHSKLDINQSKLPVCNSSTLGFEEKRVEEQNPGGIQVRSFK